MGNSQSQSEPITPQRSREKDKDKAGTSSSHHASSSSKKVPHANVTSAGVIPASTTSSASTSTSTSNATSSPVTFHTRQQSGFAASPQSKMGQTSSTPGSTPKRSNTQSSEKESQAAPSPVDIPKQPHHDGPDETIPPSGASPYGLPPSNFSRPPRLPLPIERDPEPTSPIVSPQEANAPQEPSSEIDEAGGLPRRASMLSQTTLDDDDAADIETFVLESDPGAQKVPTTLQWKGDGDQVYVTGTFAKWEKKFRMHKDEEKGAFTTTFPLPTGTHHLKFLVDGDMETSNELPTTVDFTNALVNYIEVAAPMPSAAEAQPAAPAEPMPIPGVDVNRREAAIQDVRPVAETGDEIRLEPTAPPTTTVPKHSSQPKPVPERPKQDQRQQNKSTASEKKKLPRAKYTNEIPDILLHLDLYNHPDDERYRRASKAIQHLPQPPSLPMFMSKSILNAATPHKDDASVLTMPNHTVLNHLATSSIRSGVLATSGTTRYKRKFLTTIMYKPTSDDG